MRCPLFAEIAIGIITIVIGFDASQAADEIRSTEFEIVPFKHIVSIEPGRTKYSAVLKQLGKPEQVEVSTFQADQKLLDRVDDHRTRQMLERGVSWTILSYPTRGIRVIVPSSSSDSVVDSIYVEAPFKGRSENGLHLGMSKKDALSVCDRDYFRTMDLGSSYFFALKKGGNDPFQIWFENDQLIRMKLFPSRK